MSKLDRYKTADGDEVVRKGRLDKARDFQLAASWLRELDTSDGTFSRSSPVANAYVVLLILSGIASADALCIASLRKYSQGDDHRQAVEVLTLAAGRPVAKHLDTLLGLKTRSEYSATLPTDRDLYSATEAAEALYAAAVRTALL
ncbi:hypothetical protein [uncultured Amnibacterium sp.]|uniref:hypothetical protein n=1 Tax=uncultured Amnibacterium sp. TaxID=1631851 RepID=UPI0035CAA6A4